MMKAVASATDLKQTSSRKGNYHFPRSLNPVARKITTVNETQMKGTETEKL